MDPIAHTLLGATLGRAGLARKTALATPALLLGANLADVDILAYLRGETFALSFRRGHTHGILAVAVAPFLLTAALLAWDRWVRRRRDRSLPPASAPWLLAISAIAIASHPLLDWLNTYGIRLLMPFDDRWFYGDTLFIVDLVFWGILGAAFALPRAFRALPREGTARVCLALLFLYLAGNKAAERFVRARALDEADRPGRPVARLMAGPVPGNPFERFLVADAEDAVLVAAWQAPAAFGPWLTVPRRSGDTGPEAEAALGAALARKDVREFLSWARFPVARVARQGEGWLVEFADVRYASLGRTGFGTHRVLVPAAFARSVSREQR